MTTPTDASDLILASRKDEIYQRLLHRDLHDATVSLFGLRVAVVWKRELELLADGAFFLATTLATRQTLGEEYAGVLQISVGTGTIPTAWVRLAEVIGLVGVPYAIEKSAQHLNRLFLNNRSLNLPGALADSWLARRAAQLLVAHCEQLAVVLRHVGRAHLAAFYLNGAYYHVVKRMLGVRHVLLRGVQPGSRPNFYLLGILLLVQFGVKLGAWLWRHRTRLFDRSYWLSNSAALAPKNSKPRNNESKLIRCPLCLDHCASPTITPCGHIFCWNCIFESAREQLLCPLCRQELKLGQLTATYNLL